METPESVIAYLNEFPLDEPIIVPIIWDKATAEAEFERTFTPEQWLKIIEVFNGIADVFDASTYQMDATLNQVIQSK